MLASIQKVEGGYVARFDRPFKHSVEKVWAALTENDKNLIGGTELGHL
jgi:hypothetical protein